MTNDNNDLPPAYVGPSAEGPAANTTALPRLAVEQIPLRFVGSGAEYFRIWIVNILLTLVTFGFYYPWARVRRIKYFYNHTLVGEHGLDFHGKGSRMLVGMLLVAGLFGIYNVAQQWPIAYVVASLMFVLVWPPLVQAALRFRLANTSWRGLRFRFEGVVRDAFIAIGIPLALVLMPIAVGQLLLPDVPEPPKTEQSPRPARAPANNAEPQAQAPKEEAQGQEEQTAKSSQQAQAKDEDEDKDEDESDQSKSKKPTKPKADLPAPGPIFFSLLSLLALTPWLMPWFYWRSARYMHGGFRLGQAETELRLGPGKVYWVFFKAFLVTSGVVAIVAVLVAVLAGAASFNAMGAGNTGKSSSGASFVGIAVVVGLAYLFIIVFLNAYLKTHLQNLLWSNTGGSWLRFKSDLRFLSLLGLMFKNWILIALTLGFYWLARSRGARPPAPSVTWRWMGRDLT